MGYERCLDCGDVLVQDGTEQADFAVRYDYCHDEHEARLNENEGMES